MCTPVIFAYFSSIFNGFFAWLVGLIPESAPLRRWQYLYLMTGSINVLYSLLLCAFLPDSPMNARFLTPEERFWAVRRLAANRTGIASRAWRWDQAREALLDARVWLVFLFNVAINIPNGGLQAFGTIIIADLGFGSLGASLLTMPFGVLATSSAWLFSYAASRWHNRRTVVASAALLLPILGTALVYGLPRSNVAGQLVGLYFMYFYWRESSPPTLLGPAWYYEPYLQLKKKKNPPSTLRGWHIIAPGQHGRADEEVGGLQPRDHWLRGWKPDRAPDLHLRTGAQVHGGRRCDAGLLLHFHPAPPGLLRCGGRREQEKGSKVRQARSAS